MERKYSAGMNALAVMPITTRCDVELLDPKSTALTQNLSRYATRQAVVWLPVFASQGAVVRVTVLLATVWQRCAMGVGMQSQILKASNALKACLIGKGERVHFSPADTLFLEGSDNSGVFW
jgi:hypothetical protein